VGADGLAAGPLGLLDELYGRTGPQAPRFAEWFGEAVRRGDLEVMEALVEGRAAGVLVLAFRPSVSLGGFFASIEDLYVRPEARNRGVGRALLEAVEGRCREHGVSYTEVQTDVEASGFYRKLGYEHQPDVSVLFRSHPIEESPGGPQAP